MKWKQAISRFGDKQSHGIQSDEYHIGRFLVKGIEKYGLYYGNATLGFYESPAVAKHSADDHLQSLSLGNQGDGC